MQEEVKHKELINKSGTVKQRVLPPTTYLGTALLMLLLGLLYASTCRNLLTAWRADINSSHGALIPIIVIYLGWRKRHYLRSIPKRSCGWGILLVLIGAVLLPVAKAGQVVFFEYLSLLLVLGGIVWHIWGSRVMRALLFPYLFMFLALPWPGLFVETLTFHLQLISTKSAVMIAGLLGVPVIREGVEIQTSNYTFAVAAPCSGMRSLTALLALGALIAFMFKGTLGRRMLLIIMVPIIAVMGNVVRIVITLLLALNWGGEAATGFYHELSGVIVFFITLVLLIFCARLLGIKHIREDV